MKLVRSGVTRTVLLVGRWAIKFPSLRTYGGGPRGALWSFTRGVQANLSEREWSGYVAYRGKLCPVVFSLWGLVNVYPRATPLRGTRRLHMLLFHRKLRLLRINPQPGDDKVDNYGWLGPADGGYLARDLVILDYDMSYNGCPHDHSGAANRLEFPGSD